MTSDIASSEIIDFSVPSSRKYFDFNDEMDGAEIIFTVTEGTLRYTVKNISKMKIPQYSSVWVIRSLPWKIMVHPVSNGGLKNQSPESLGFFLQCDTKDLSDTCGCDAVAELRLLSCKEGEKPFTRRIQHFYYNLENDWGYTHFISWKDLLDPDNGYVHDDSITVEAHVVTGEPIEIDLEMLKLLESVPSQRRESLSISDEDISKSDISKGDSSVDMIKQVKKKSVGKLRYTVKNLEELKECEYSLPFNINDLPWRLVIKPNVRGKEKKGQEKYVGVYVKCDGLGNSSPWLVYASIFLRIIPVKEDVDAFDEVFSHYFTCEEVACGIPHFLPMDYLLNPENGFIPEDGSVTFEAHMFVDKCQGTSLNSQRFLSEIKPNDCKIESEIVYKFKVDYISSLEESRLSPTFKLHGLSWSIIISPESIYHGDESTETLGFFLRCQGLPLLKNWCCYAAAELRLLSNKADQKPFSRRIYHIFDNVKKTWGFKEFLPWKQILDPENGYIINDSITVEIHVLTEPPYINKLKKNNNKLRQKLLNVIDEDESSIPTPGRQEEKLIINNLFSFTCNDSKNILDEKMPEVKFQFIVQNVSQLREVTFSPQIVVSNLLWRMRIVPRIRESLLQAEMLGFFLECGPITESSKTWCCYANATLRLLSCQKGKPNLSTKIQHLFNPKDTSSGCIEFIRWDDLLDSENGFLENDTVTFEIDLQADPPYDINSNKKSSS